MTRERLAELSGEVAWRVVSLRTRRWSHSLCWGGDCLHALDYIRPFGDGMAIVRTHCRLGWKMPRRRCPYYEETVYRLTDGGD